jgi:hypothetical protein
LFFRNEVDFYTKLKPKLDKLVSCPETQGLKAPTCYYASDEKGVIVMENLKTSSFRNMDKKDGLDSDHMKKVLEQLARFHGVSYHLMESYFGGIKRFLKVIREMEENFASIYPLDLCHLFSRTFGL